MSPAEVMDELAEQNPPECSLCGKPQVMKNCGCCWECADCDHMPRWVWGLVVALFGVVAYGLWRVR